MGKKKKQERAKRAKLLDGTGGVTEAFDSVLEQIFTRFDRDGDQVLSEAELHCFASVCNEGEQFSSDELEEIRTYFDCDDSGSLTLKGFKELMITQTGGRLEDTWRDLTRLGYDENLKHEEQNSEAEAAGASGGSTPAVSQSSEGTAKAAGRSGTPSNEQLSKEHLGKFLASVKDARASKDPVEIARVKGMLEASGQADHPLVQRLLGELSSL